MHRVLPVVLLLLAGCLGTGGSGVDDASGAGDSDDAGSGGADPADGATDPAGDDGSGTGGETTGNGTDPDGGAAGNGTDASGPGTGDGTTGTSTQTSSSGTETSSSNSTDTGTSDPGTRLLEVSAWDVTTSLFTRPQETEIEVVPNGTWKPNFSYGSDGPHPMGHHPVSVLHEDAFIVRPDGPSGTQCVTDFMVTEAMEDYTAEAISHVEIRDTEVWIYGPAIPGHPDYDTPYICAR